MGLLQIKLLNKHAQVFVRTYISISLGQMLRSTTVRCMLGVSVFLKENSKLLYSMVALFPPATDETCNFSAFSPAFGIAINFLN